MKGSKRGFTLVELLTVIAILAVILIISVPIVITNINKAKDKSYDSYHYLLNQNKRLIMQLKIFKKK